jgi:hypothetical protein
LPPEFSSSSATSIWRSGGATYVSGSAVNGAIGRSEAVMWVGWVAEPRQ